MKAGKVLRERIGTDEFAFLVGALCEAEPEIPAYVRRALGWMQGELEKEEQRSQVDDFMEATNRRMGEARKAGRA